MSKLKVRDFRVSKQDGDSLTKWLPIKSQKPPLFKKLQDIKNTKEKFKMHKSKPNKTPLSRHLILQVEETDEESTASLSDSEVSLVANDVANKTANLQTILQELRESRRENGEGFREVKEEIKNINGRLDEAEMCIMEAENKIQQIEEAAMKQSKAQDEIEAKLIGLEVRARQNLIQDKLDIPTSRDLGIEELAALWDPEPHTTLPHQNNKSHDESRLRCHHDSTIYNMGGQNKECYLDQLFGPGLERQIRSF
ncbi:hypothetical protein CRENBAI_011851 [Crenichthys baileyi]|uniref:Uncharacterized protein n=1 Tax=Crenichthys baileyi TaxID=28760 RepID=A0AAV9RU78_9TELE